MHSCQLLDVDAQKEISSHRFLQKFCILIVSCSYWIGLQVQVIHDTDFWSRITWPILLDGQLGYKDLALCSLGTSHLILSILFELIKWTLVFKVRDVFCCRIMSEINWSNLSFYSQQQHLLSPFLEWWQVSLAWTLPYHCLMMLVHLSGSS